MAHAGATLQGLNNEMVSCIEDLKTKRDAVSERVLEKQEEKLKIQNDLHVLTERLARVTDDLTKMSAERDDYDRTISDSEATYMKILESTQALLSVLKAEVKS
eukprot:m.102420 g.102420  ORF g.102420 m.102420 type:complete len:103 (+) comp20807_c0_seq1:49-357(+)